MAVFEDEYKVDTSDAIRDLNKLERAQEQANAAAADAGGKLGKFGEASEKAADASANLADGLFNLKEGGIEPAIGGLAGLAGVLGGPALQGAITAALFLVLLFKDKLGELSDQLSGQSRKSLKDYMDGVDKLNAELEEVRNSIQTYTDMQKLTIEQGKEYQKLRERESELNEQITKQTEEEARAKAEIARLESLKEAKGKSADEKQALVERQIREQGGSEIADIEKSIVDKQVEQIKKDAEARTKAIQENIGKAPKATVIDGDSGPIRIGPEGSLTDQEREQKLEEARQREKDVIAKAESEARKRAQSLLIGLTKGDTSSIEQLKNEGFKDSKLVKGVESTLNLGKTEADQEAERVAEEKAKRQREDAARAERAKKKAAPQIKQFIQEATEAAAKPFRDEKARVDSGKAADKGVKAKADQAADEFLKNNQDLVDSVGAARASGMSEAEVDKRLQTEIERRTGYRRTGNKIKDQKSMGRKDLESSIKGKINDESMAEYEKAIADLQAAGARKDEAVILYLNSVNQKLAETAARQRQMEERLNQARQALRPGRPSILPTYN